MDAIIRVVLETVGHAPGLVLLGVAVVLLDRGASVVLHRLTKIEDHKRAILELQREVDALPTTTQEERERLYTMLAEERGVALGRGCISHLMLLVHAVFVWVVRIGLVVTLWFGLPEIDTIGELGAPHLVGALGLLAAAALYGVWSIRVLLRRTDSSPNPLEKTSMQRSLWMSFWIMTLLEGTLFLFAPAGLLVYWAAVKTLHVIFARMLGEHTEGTTRIAL